jgi:hypothetical protein
LDSATVATPALPLVETVSDDDFVLAGDGVCATSAGSAPVKARSPVVWDILVAKSNVPDAPQDLDFRKYFALSSFSRVHQLEYAFVPDIYDMSGDGAPLRICRDHKLRDFASFGLPDSDEGWVALLSKAYQRHRFYYRYWLPPSRTLIRLQDMGIHGDQSTTPYELSSYLRALSVPVAGEDTLLGFVFSECSHRLRACLSTLQPRAPVSIQGRSVCTVEQANLAPTPTLDAS